MDYIREHYNKGLRRGARVQVRWHGELHAATIVGSSDAYLRLRLHPLHRPLLFHPNDIEQILPDEPAEAVQPCMWREEGEGEYWAAACGQANWFADGGPLENYYKFCPYCGRPIATAKAPESTER